MKYIKYFLIVTILFTLTCNASEPKIEISTIINDEINVFINELPKEITSMFPKEIWSGDLSDINQAINENSIVKSILNYVFIGLESSFKSLGFLMIIILISSLLNGLNLSIISSNSFSFATSLFVALTSFSICTSLSALTKDFMLSLCKIMESFAPLMATLFIMTGNITSSGVVTSSFLLFIAITERFILTLMYPIINISICLSIAKSINSNFDLSGISKTLKNTFTGVTIFVMSIFMFILSCKNVLSQSTDSVSIKTAKFAISSFIPIVGSTVNESLRTVIASLSLVKNSCGILAIIVIVFLALPIIISLLLNKMVFNISSTISKALGCNNESAILDEISSICGFMLLLVISTCILFIFAITLLIKATVNL